MSTIDRHQARFMAQVAEALENIPKATPDYGGEFYVSCAVIAYDGEETGWMVSPNEFGGYEIAPVRAEADVVVPQQRQGGTS